MIDVWAFHTKSESSRRKVFWSISMLMQSIEKDLGTSIEDIYWNWKECKILCMIFSIPWK